MNPIDPKWLELLKASKWQLGGLSAALFAFWYFVKAGILPPTDATLVVYVVPFAGLVAGCLAIASIVEEIAGWVGKVLKRRTAEAEKRKNLQQEQDDLRDYIPFMLEGEKEIIGCMLILNEKTIKVGSDGGRAATLVSRGVVRAFARPGQHVDMISMPFVVPDHLWEVLQENADQFPDKFDKKNRRPWQSGF